MILRKVFRSALNHAALSEESRARILQNVLQQKPAPLPKVKPLLFRGVVAAATACLAIAGSMVMIQQYTAIPAPSEFIQAQSSSPAPQPENASQPLQDNKIVQDALPEPSSQPKQPAQSARPPQAAKQALPSQTVTVEPQAEEPPVRGGTAPSPLVREDAVAAASEQSPKKKEPVDPYDDSTAGAEVSKEFGCFTEDLEMEAASGMGAPENMVEMGASNTISDGEPLYRKRALEDIPDGERSILTRSAVLSGFRYKIATVLPSGYRLEEFNNTESNAVFYYANSTDSLTITAQNGIYPAAFPHEAYRGSGLTVAMEKKGSRVCRAVWTDAGVTYTLVATAGLDPITVLSIVESMKLT